jgi:hypothetical protein
MLPSWSATCQSCTWLVMADTYSTPPGCRAVLFTELVTMLVKCVARSCFFARSCLVLLSGATDVVRIVEGRLCEEGRFKLLEAICSGRNEA